jgi:hypothetical protein
MQSALKFGEFYAAHAERVAKTFGASPEARIAMRILYWLKREKRATFQTREVYRALNLRARDTEEPLALLEETGHIRKVPLTDVDSGGKSGRKPSPAWKVNPALWDSVNSVIEVKQ